MESLAQADLNLLVVMNVLLEEGGVTRAAERLHLSQPAVSRALQRARELFDDRLLVREGRTMVPTARAAQLRVPIRRILGDVDALLRQSAIFDPSSSHRRFVVGASDYSQVGPAAAAITTIGKTAPGVELVFLPYPRHFERQLESGQMDVVIGPERSELSWIESVAIAEEGYCCAGRRGHPALARLDIETYLAYSHLITSPSGTGLTMVDAALAQKGKKRNIATRVPDFAGAFFVCAQTELLLTAPATIVQQASKLLPLDWAPLPLKFPATSIYLNWHARFNDDAGSRWLRGLLQRPLALELGSPQGSN